MIAQTNNYKSISEKYYEKFVAIDSANINYLFYPGISLKYIDDTSALFAMCCNVFNMPPEDVKSTRRQIAIYVKMLYCKLARMQKVNGKLISYSVIGRAANMDHATVMHAEKRFNDEYSFNQEFRKTIDNSIFSNYFNKK